MFIHRQKQKGMVLICAVAILAVLSIMATSFVRMMTLNLQAAKNHLNYVDAKFAAIAGIEDAKAKMWTYMLSNRLNEEGPYIGRFKPVVPEVTDPQNSEHNNPERDLFWYPNASNSDLERASQLHQRISMTEVQEAPFSYSGVVGRRRNTNEKLGRYESNGNTYALKIQDNQGKLNLNSHRPYGNDNNDNTRMRSNQVMHRIIECLAIQCNLGTVATQLADALRPINNELPTWSSMLEIQSIVEGIIPNDSANRRNFLNNICVASMMDSNCYTLREVRNQDMLILLPYVSQDDYYREYRSPVNIHTASPELLAALIQAVESRTYVYRPTPTPTSIEGFSGPLTTETRYDYDINSFRYQIVFTREQAMRIARQIVQGRNNIHSISELEAFLRNCDFPNNQNSMSGRYSQFSDELWTNICVDTLMANFNPNVRENFYNSDTGYMSYVQKNNLHNYNRPTYSTELCFEPSGFIGVQSLGKITANTRNLVVASSILEENVGLSSIVSLRTNRDFTDNHFHHTGSGGLFPRFNDRLQQSVGYIKGDFFRNRFNFEQDAYDQNYLSWKNTFDGIMMTEIDANENIGNPTYRQSNNFTQSNLPAQYYHSDQPQDGDLSINPEYIYRESGQISFWFKPTERWDSSIFCSLFSGSYLNPTNKQYVPYPVTYDNSGYSRKATYKDGIQMYVYKNTNSQLVVSRLFFCGYYTGNTASSYTGIGKENTGIAVDVDSAYLPGQSTCMVNGTLVSNQPQRKYARVDAIIPLPGNSLRRNQWSCLTINWNDRSGSLQATLRTPDSNNNTLNSTPYIRGDENTTSRPQFCVLNEINPPNRIQINGFARRQFLGGGNADGRLFLLGQNIHLPGNSTINDVRRGNPGNISFTGNNNYQVDIINLASNDDNRNPFFICKIDPVRTTRIAISTWGYIDSTESNNNRFTARLNQIAYSIRSNPVQITTDALNNRIIPRNNNIPLHCDITFQGNNNISPTILDSISLKIFYPYTVCSSILR